MFSRRWASRSVFALVVIGGAFLFTSPIPQDPNYHLFADGRVLFGVPNVWNVLSNFPFLVVGLLGVDYVRRHNICDPDLKPAYIAFFLGILLTAFGSGYYHLAPNNNSLVLDRLPMTIGFAGLFSIVIGEFVSKHAARVILLPLLAIGIASVFYWAITEARGVGDLRPYAVVQFLPMLLIPVILTTYRSSGRMGRYFWLMILFYVLAKLAEFFDAQIFAAGHFVSGHTLKHLFASVTPAILLYALAKQKEVNADG